MRALAIHMGRGAGMTMAALALSGCFDPDAAVFVDVSVSDASAALQSSSLVTGFEGSFTLHMHLGPRANGESTVNLGSVSVTNSDRSVTLVDAFSATPEPRFPLTVAIDGDVDVAFTASSEDNQLEADAVEELCAAGGLVYVVVVDDSLRGGTVSASSPAFMPAGCP